jgi:hypothetical protein
MNKELSSLLQRKNEMELIEDAISLLPGKLSAAYQEACEKAPELVANESNRAWFLR